MHKKLIFSFAIIIIMNFILIALGQEKLIEKIDIYDDNVGNFLEIDLDNLYKGANAAYQLGNYEESARYYLKYLNHNVNDYIAMYNLACCYGLLDKPKLAAKFLRKACDAGYSNISWMQKDTDFDKVRDDQIFIETEKEIISEYKEIKAESGDMIYFDANSLFQCNLNFPKEFDSQKEYPLLIGLHGYGGTPDLFSRMWSRFDNPDFIFAVPQAPYAIPVSGELGFSWINYSFGDSAITDEQRNFVGRMSEAYILEAVQTLKNKYKISKVYLLGFSQGGRFALDTGIDYPEVFEGAVCFGAPLGGANFTKEELEKAKDLRLFFAYGEEDRVVDLEEMERIEELLMQHDYDFKVVQFSGGHVLPESMPQKAREWLMR